MLVSVLGQILVFQSSVWEKAFAVAMVGGRLLLCI